MNPELRQLRYFKAVAEELHFGRAAERVFITQPSLSHQIAQLEQNLGVSLLQRTQRRVSLTPAGAALLEVTRRVLTDLERGVEDVRRIGGALSGELRVGLLYAQYRHQSTVASAIKVFNQQHPNLSVQLLELHEQPFADLLRMRALDVALVHAPVTDERLEVVNIASERYAVALSAKHPLAVCSQIALSTLSDETWLLPPRELVPDKHDEILGYCRRAGFEPRLGPAPRAMTQMLAMVVRGEGISLVPEGIGTLPDGGMLKPLSSPYAVANLIAVRLREEASTAAQAFTALFA
jgi:LysR family transcriptional regulator, benzoate and cis,cis-muconate-responsive activator of ben and cat genes